MVTNPVFLRADPGGYETAGNFHDASLQPRANFSRPRITADRAADLSPDRRGRAARDALDGIRLGDAALQRRLNGCALRDATAASVAAVQPGETRQHRAELVLQHGGLIHDQHQLAELRPRSDDELPD